MSKAKDRKKGRVEARRKKKSKGGTKAGKLIRKTKSKVKKAVNKLKEIGGFAVLLPFRKPMEKLLSSKGVTPADKFDDLVQQFHSVVIEKKSSYDDPPKPLEHLLPVVIGTIIQAVVAFFKGLKEKKESGAKMSDSENTALDLAETASAEIVDEVQTEAKTQAFEPMLFIIIIIVVIMMIK